MGMLLVLVWAGHAASLSVRRSSQIKTSLPVGAGGVESGPELWTNASLLQGQVGASSRSVSWLGSESEGLEAAAEPTDLERRLEEFIRGAKGKTRDDDAACQAQVRQSIKEIENITPKLNLTNHWATGIDPAAAGVHFGLGLYTNRNQSTGLLQAPRNGIDVPLSLWSGTKGLVQEGMIQESLGAYTDHEAWISAVVDAPGVDGFSEC